jgi:hypothetical protein
MGGGKGEGEKDGGCGIKGLKAESRGWASGLEFPDLWGKFSRVGWRCAV